MEDLSKAFPGTTLQLQKYGKKIFGPVGKDHREEIWDAFSNATKLLHQRRQENIIKNLRKVTNKNLERKRDYPNP